ncbi:hypothetical protein AB0C59_14565 [Streptomyces sp. NPDC048664]|uniref:hypothetical protein n=1 Tax=Streptomyces sp. NPDC048664 TaxID=3154505 RepID=UPI00342CA37C
MPYARRAALTLLTALTVLWGAAPAFADRGWSVLPATGGAGGRPYVYAEGAPGTVLQDAVSVLNPGTRPLTVRLSGADTEGGPAGRGGPTGRAEPGGAGAWIRFAGTTAGRRAPVPALGVTVPARTRADVPFTVTVPPGAAPGDRLGAIVADAGAGRTSAVPIRLRVVGPSLAALTVEHVRVRGGRIGYELVNRGTTVLTPRLAVRADGVLGRVLDRAPRALPLKLTPGRRVLLSEPWPHHPAFDAVHVRLTVTAAAGAHGSASASARFVPRGTLAAALAAVLCAAAGAGAVLRRRRRPPPPPRGEDRAGTRAESKGAVR